MFEMSYYSVNSSQFMTYVLYFTFMARIFFRRMIYVPINSCWSTVPQATLDVLVINCNGLLSFGWTSSTAFANESSHNLNEFVCSVQLIGLLFFFFAHFNNPVRGACTAASFYGVVFVDDW